MENTIPISSIAFARPDYIQSQINYLEKLNPRVIYFFLDGVENPWDRYYKDNLKVKNLVLEYAEISKHKVQVFLSKTNLGCNQNTIKAIKFMSCNFEYFMILEEDVEFRMEYISFLDKNLANFKNWGVNNICGHNVDYDQDLSQISRDTKIEFKFSKFMSSCWGMCASRDSAKDFFYTLSEHKNLNWKLIFSKFSDELGKNYLEKRRIFNYWVGKYQIASRTWDKACIGYDSKKETGWDTWWQFSAMASNLNFLTPTFSLARERIGQHENSWHTQNYDTSRLYSWSHLDYQIQISPKIDLENQIIFENYGRFPFKIKKKSFLKILAYFPSKVSIYVKNIFKHYLNLS